MIEIPSKWIDKEIVNLIEEKIKTIQQRKNELTEEEIDEVMPIVIKHYKKHINDREIFKDKKGGSYVLITIPTEAKISKYKRDDGTISGRITCIFKNGFVGVFGDAEFWNTATKKGESYWIRGRLTEQYSIAGTWGTGKQHSERQYYKTLDKACKDNELDKDDLDEDDILVTYTLNAWQNMG